MKIKNKKVLIIVAHTDDETFGCGGLIKKLSLNNNIIRVISFTNGVGSRSNQKSLQIEERKRSSENASKVLGFKWLAQYDYSDNELDKASLLEIIKIIEKHKRKFKPNIILTHNFSDLNIDHRKVAEATLTAFRPEPKEKLEQLLTFEVPSATDFRMLKNKKKFFTKLLCKYRKKYKFKN